MNKNTLRNLATTLMLTIVFVTFTFITKFVDISSFYPIDQRTLLPVVEIVGKIGLSSLNIPFFKAIGFNSICYLLSEIFGYLLIVGIAFYFVLFIIQAIKNKSLLKVNKDLWVICIFSISLFAIDLIFRFVAINYRPILEIGKNSLESSYPSSHTLLAGSISGASIVFILRNIKNNKAKIILDRKSVV